MFQRVIIAGYLGRDPEMRYTDQGKAVTNLNVATSRKWTGANDQQQEETIWWRVSVWGKQAETCNEYLSKGRAVIIEGRMRPDKETGGPRVYQRKDGSWGASYEMTARSVRFIGGRTGEAGTAASTPEEPPPGFVEENTIPF